MGADFVLTVIHKGQKTDYVARLLLQGYTYKIIVAIGDTEVCFEPDEEGSFRVVKMPDQDEKLLEKTDKTLLESLKQKIEEVLV